jgi:putative ABC transport system permease protein
MPPTLLRDRLRRCRHWAAALFHPRRLEREFQEELAFHQSLDPRERARTEATREAWRAAGHLYGLQTFARDLRYGARLLRRSPLFTTVAVASLGLGIGLNLALFSLLNAVLLRPLQFRQPQQLYALASTSASQHGRGGNVGWQTIEDWKSRTHAFSAIASYYSWSPTLQSGPGGAQVLDGLHVSANFFPTLGVAPLLGRVFTVDEDRPNRNHVVMLSYGLWRREFAADPGIVGRAITINRSDYTVIGVLPRDLESALAAVQIWSPEGYDATVPAACRSCQHLHAVARLAPGVTPAAAAAGMNAVEHRLAALYPNDLPRDAEVAMRPLRDTVVGGIAGTLWMLFAATGLVLLMVAVNLANLLLARAAERRREMAVRAALGAGLDRLLRQWLTEGALLGLLGGVAGVVLAWASLRALGGWAAAAMPRLDRLGVDARVLGFGLLLSLATGLLLGCAPAWEMLRRLRRAAPAAALQAARGAAGARSGPRRLLVGAEAALALLLAVAAGLVLKSFLRVSAVTPGFDPRHVYSADFILSGPGYAADAAVNRFDQQLLDRLAAAPGLEAAGLVSVLPLDPGNYDTRGYLTLDPPVTTRAAMGAANAFYDTYFVSPGYFAAMDIGLRRGRLLTAGDMLHPALATVVSESLARKLWPGRNPLGQAIALAGQQTTGAPIVWSRVVGVVNDVHQYALDRTAPPEVYLPYTLSPGAASTLVVRAHLPPAAIAAQLRQSLAALDSAVPLARGRMLTEVVAGALAQRRLTLQLIGLFSLLALALATLGIYGVVAYTTAARRGEIGLRMALGAGRRGIVGWVVAQGMRPVLLGLAAGLAAALLGGRLLSGFLFQVTPADPATLAAVALLLAALGLAACLLPAWRASRADPARILRAE